MPSEQFQSNDYLTEDTGENTTVSKGLSLAYTYDYSMGCDTSEDITKHELNITTIDNHETRRYFVSWEGMIFYAADVFFPKSCLNISLNYGNNYNKDQVLDIFTQILSTFKFTDTNISPASELLNKLNQKLNANLAFKNEIVEGKTVKMLDLSDYYNLEFSKNGGKLDIIKQTLTDFGLVYNPKLDTSDVTSRGNSYQSANLNCDLSGNEEFLWLRCY